MLRYFLENRQNVINTERVVYAINRRNFIIPVSLLIKVVPELDGGIQILGVFARVLALCNNTILLNGNTGELLGITESAYENYAIHPWLCKHVSKVVPTLNILNLLSDGGQPLSLRQVKEKAISSHTISLDTSSLVNGSYAVRADPASYKVPLPKSEEYRSFKVRIFPGTEENYGVSNLSIIPIEIRDNDDIIGFQMRNAMGLLYHHQKGIKDEDDSSAKGKPMQSKHGNMSHADGQKTGKFRLSVMKTIRAGADEHIDKDQNKEEDMGQEEVIFDRTSHPEGKAVVRKKTFNQYKIEQEMTEKQLEEMEKRAERERKLKEHRQLLKTRGNSAWITAAYLTISVATAVIFVFHFVVLSLKIKVLDAMMTDSTFTAIFAKRESYLPEIAYLLTKMNNTAQ